MLIEIEFEDRKYETMDYHNDIICVDTDDSSSKLEKAYFDLFLDTELTLRRHAYRMLGYHDQTEQIYQFRDISFPLRNSKLLRKYYK